MLDGIDLSVGRGEAVGLVGESGSGKSVTWLAALGLLPRRRAVVSGSVKLDGTDILGAAAAIVDTVRGGRVAMIFQDPASALNPVLTIGQQVGEALALHRRPPRRGDAAPKPDGCSISSAFRMRRGGFRPIRMNSPADRTSAS